MIIHSRMTFASNQNYLLLYLDEKENLFIYCIVFAKGIYEAKDGFLFTKIHYVLIYLLVFFVVDDL